MHDNDIFLNREEAVVLGCFLAFLAAVAFGVQEPKAKPRPAEARCHVTVVQYDAGERWVRKPKQPACAGDLAALPDHILTTPLEAR